MKIHSKSNLKPLSNMQIFIGLMFGFTVGCTYFLFKFLGVLGGLNLFFLASFYLFVLHFLFSPKRTIKSLLNKKLGFRGVLFGLAQILLFSSQKTNSTSSVLVASICGSLTAIIVGRFYLKERSFFKDYLSILFSFLSILLTAFTQAIPYMAIVAGSIQGLSSVLVRSLMNKNEDIFSSMASGFFWASIVTFMPLIKTMSCGDIVNVIPIKIFFSCLLLYCTQFGLFYLYKSIDTQRGSVLALFRIPTVCFLEWIFLGIYVDKIRAFTILLILISASLISLNFKPRSKIN